MAEDLKDPKCFKDIEKKLIMVVFSDHKHKTVKSYVGCKRCRAKLEKKTKMIKDFGFKDYGQYSEWRRVMSIITNEKDFKVS